MGTATTPIISENTFISELHKCENRNARSEEYYAVRWFQGVDLSSTVKYSAPTLYAHYVTTGVRVPLGSNN